MALDDIVTKEQRQRMKQQPKILLFDIETAPNLAYVWGKYEQNAIAFESEWYMLSFAWKWSGDKKVQARSLPDYRGYNKNPMDDSAMLKDLHSLFDEADVIVAHNGDQFDIKKTNARFIINGLHPPAPYKTIDTKKVAKKYFNFTSNSLNDLGQNLNLGKKLPTGGFDLWLGCMQGDQKSWDKMVKYNKMDVELLEKVYETMKPWMTNHPHVGLYQGKACACPNCGGEDLQKRGFSYTRTGKYQRLQCLDCSAWSQQRKGEKVYNEVK